ncbi:Orotidine 5'-phosphate decarboxylase [subsurface metagenome]
MKSYPERIEAEWEKKETLLCFGMDPVIERMKIDTSKDLADEIVAYFSKILHEISGKISAVKPNVACYLQYGTKGLSALVELINRAKTKKLPVIIDAKVGDIGRTSKAYAKYIFEVLKGDAVTLNPYMGYDSLEPFFTWKDKGFYVLALTSNDGAHHFQYERLGSGKPFYEYVIQTLCSWNKKHNSIGAVIGATQEEFKGCVEKMVNMKCIIPLLIPGVGAQGGSYSEIEKILENVQYNKGIARINASSSISYAHERFPSSTFEEASYLAVEEILKG